MAQLGGSDIKHDESNRDNDDLLEPERERPCEQRERQQRLADLIETHVLGSGLEVQPPLRCT